MPLSPSVVRSCASLARSTRPSPCRQASPIHPPGTAWFTLADGHPIGEPKKKITLGTLRSLHKKGEPIAVLTAHDFPSAHVADAAGMDIILVGDSLAMVALGMEDTSEVLLEEMLLHCRSVARATKAAFTVSLNASPALDTPSSRLQR